MELAAERRFMGAIRSIPAASYGGSDYLHLVRVVSGLAVQVKAGAFSDRFRVM
jgi:hypothetical protein